MLDHCNLVLVENLSHVTRGQLEEAESGSAAGIEVVTTEPKRSRMCCAPGSPELIRDEFPQVVLAPVEDPMVNRQGGGESQCENRALYGGCQVVSISESCHKFVYLLCKTDHPPGDPLVALNTNLTPVPPDGFALDLSRQSLWVV